MNTLDRDLNDLLETAILVLCTDIHFDIHRERVRIEFRRHKQHIQVYVVSNGIALFEHLRFVSGFDLARPYAPQTGRFEYVVDECAYDFRFASLQTMHRKHGVLRILNMNSIQSLRDSVGLKKDRVAIERLLRERNGIVLFGGQTGSGKTTTMFNALKILEHRVIFSLENPIERMQTHCIQIELNRELDFETGLTQLLRHDPDVIVLGEIRSEADIKQCIRCGLSGHLVLSTIHAGSVNHVLNRLYDLGATQYDLSHVLKGIVYQEMKVSKKGVRVSYSIISECEIEAYLKGVSGQETNSSGS